MNKEIGVYDFYLPCYLPEDDLDYQLISNSIKQSFENMANTYDKCAKLCRRMVGVASEIPELDIDISEHGILVAGPKERLDGLVKEDILSFYSEEEDEDYSI
jgi:hypothetical protein